LLLFAHGARDPRWALPFEDIARRIGAQAPQVPVQLAFLEFMSPGLVDAGAMLAAKGCASVDIVPLFLGAGGHVRKDLPGLVDTLQGLHPQVQWQLRPAIGEVDAVVQAMATAALAWTEAPPPAAVPAAVLANG
jgi:sirohydrochlorin cobaltochelatase